jgi:hypothetical protein
VHRLRIQSPRERPGFHGESTDVRAAEAQIYGLPRAVILSAAKDLQSAVILNAVKDLQSAVILNAVKDLQSAVILNAVKDLLFPFRL